VIRVDLPGFGASAARDDAVDSLAGRARAIVSLADHLQLPRFAVLGHSMGGGTALVLAHSRPERVSHLVLVASVALSRHRGLGRPPWRFALIARAVGVPLLGSALLRAAREQYRRRGFPGADAIDATTLRLHLRAIAATDFSLLRQAVKSPLPPTLVAYAHDDHMVERWISEQLVAALSAPRVLAFSDGGHNLQKTRAPELAAAVGDWLCA
jgi:pimeloyl-ACP methyl ester carboxylesterase